MSVSNQRVCEVFDMMVGMISDLSTKIDDIGRQVTQMESRKESVNWHIKHVKEAVHTTTDALDSRFDTLDTVMSQHGDRLTVLKARLDMQLHAVMYADSMRPIGKPFLAKQLTGECVELTVYHKFNAEGVLVGDDLDMHHRVIVILKSGHHYIDSSLTTPAHVQHVRNNHSQVRGIGVSWVLFTAISIGLAVGITGDLLRMSGHDKAMGMELHTIPEWQSRLALSFLRSSGEVCEWSKLTPSQRSSLEKRGGSFFTRKCLVEHLELKSTR